MALLQLEHVQRIFAAGKNQVTALRDISFEVSAGDYVAIMGESGAGKTTLLNIIATLDQPSNGVVSLNDQDQLKASNAAESFICLCQFADDRDCLYFYRFDAKCQFAE